MKYINAKELLMFLHPPITRLSVFAAETIDAMLVMCAAAFPKLEEHFKVIIDFPTFKFQLMKTATTFVEERRAQEDEYLNHPRSRVDQVHYDQSHIQIHLWPQHMQKQNGENFFLMQYVTTLADIMFRYLLDSGIDKETANQLASQSLEALASWIDENCIKKCDYECIRRYDSQGYCALCSFMIQPLPCPKKQEISYERTGMSALECNCTRK